MSATIEPAQDQRRARILEGALRMFLAYGFSRTTMDDIARATEVSRPALYLVFRNKTDIYRALARELLDQSLERAEAALAGEGPLVERMEQMLFTAFHELLADVEASPHGAELLDMKNSLAGDIIAQWKERHGAMLERTFVAEVAASGADLAARGFSARFLADSFLDTLEGMKLRISDPDESLAAARQLIRVLAAALRP